MRLDKLMMLGGSGLPSLWISGSGLGLGRGSGSDLFSIGAGGACLRFVFSGVSVVMQPQPPHWILPPIGMCFWVLMWLSHLGHMKSFI